MADNPDARPAQDTMIRVSDVPHGPFIFYEIAPAFGFTNGVVNITLSANRTFAGPNGIVNEQVVVAYLRGNVQAALSLRQAIDSALLLAAPPAQGSEGKAQNHAVRHDVDGALSELPQNGVPLGDSERLDLYGPRPLSAPLLLGGTRVRISTPANPGGAMIKASPEHSYQ
jgi:hypothetical protein